MNALYKLTTMPTFVRLALCLLFSAGVHGGAVLYGTLSESAAVNATSEPLAVSLFTPQTTPVAPVVAPQDLARQPVVKTPARQSRAERPPRTTASPPRAAALDKAPVAQPAQAVQPAENSTHNCEAKELVCAPAVVAEPASSDKAMHDLPALESAVPGVQVAALQAVSPGAAADAVVAAAAGSEVIEAVPNYRSNPLPEYPYLARQKHWEGVVWLRADVSAAGLVEDLVVEQSCGYRTLDRSAIRAVKRWRFTPATRAGLPISSQVRIPVRFKLEDS